MKRLVDYIDTWGMVVTLYEREGGDSCAHGCSILYASEITRNLTGLNPSQYINKLESPLYPGRYRRHPDPIRWYSKIDIMSRDQFTSLLALIVLKRFKPERNNLFLAHLKRGLLFFWNTRKNNTYPGMPEYKWKLPDIANPAIWSMWLRAFKPAALLLYPLLMCLDVYNLISTILYRTKIIKSTLQMNQVILVDYSTRFIPTPISLLSKWIYGKKTPIEALHASWSPAWQPPVEVYLTDLVNSW